MYPIDFTTCTAIDVIRRSIVCHPSLFADAMKDRIREDLAYYLRQENAAIARSVKASLDAAERALSAIQAEDVDMFADDMGAGIIALNVACKLQCFPAHVRTSAAIRTWETA